MKELLGKDVKSKKTGLVGKVIGYDPGAYRIDALPGIRAGQPFIIVKTSSTTLERLHEDDIIREWR